MLSLVLPIHNQARFIMRNVPLVYNFLKDNGIEFELILAEDGSKDESKELCRRMEKRLSGIRLLSYEKRLGRGKALNNAFEKAKGDIVGFIDADLAPDYRMIPVMLGFFPAYDIVIGSRYAKESKIKRTVSRRLYSLFFNLFSKFLLGSKVKDHQCGFKLFKKDKIVPILKNVKDNMFFWDTEVLVRAQWRGLKIKEVGIRWSESDVTTVKIFKDSKMMFGGILRMFLERLHEKV